MIGRTSGGHGQAEMSGCDAKCVLALGNIVCLAQLLLPFVCPFVHYGLVIGSGFRCLRLPLFHWDRNASRLRDQAVGEVTAVPMLRGCV